MTAFLVIVIIVLILQLVRITYIKNKRINTLGDLQDALLAVVADSPEHEKSINKYFLYLEHTLDVSEFETLAKEMCQSLNIVPEYDTKGLISIRTIKELIAYNTRYAEQINDGIKEIIEQSDDE